MKAYRYILWILLTMLLIGCSDTKLKQHPSMTENNMLELSDLIFDEHHKHFYIDVKMKDGIIQERFMQARQLKLNVHEYRMDMREVLDEAQPHFVRGENFRSQKISELGLKGLVLVDLTLNERQVEEQRIAVENLRALFNSDNLYVAFMKGGSVTETFPVTDYLLENYFVSDHSTKKLYRSMITKLDELKGEKSAFFSSVPLEKKLMIVFSDGLTYQGDKPIDPSHFDLQQKLLKEADAEDKVEVFYVNFGKEGEEAEGVENEAENLVTYLCRQSGGAYFPSFVWVKLSKTILDNKDLETADFRLHFVNPDNKVYRGISRLLMVECLYKDSVVFYGYKRYSLGSFYNPIIVNGKGIWKIVIQGGLIFVCLFVFTYLIFQLLVPKISYELFKRKYVTRYVGRNMSFHNIQVDESCYFCKAPFEKGEEIVAKCEHVMHKSCWEENEHKCPEYGRRCKEGSHYYNRLNLLDPRNAPYYMKWLLAGVIAGASSWFCFIFDAFWIESNSLIQVIFEKMKVDPGSEMAVSLVDQFGNYLFSAPIFGFLICFFLTLFLSALSSHGNWWWKRLAVITTKAFLAAFCGYVVSFFVALIALIMSVKGSYILINWIPWTLNGYIIALAVSYGTDIQLRKALVGATISIVFGLGSMYLWNYSLNTQIDTRDLLLVSSLIYCVGLAFSLAMNFPRSERYFLRVEGPIKTMEIAIYKWMNTQVINRRVTIGKSVDCNLQMSWDVNSNISPIQAEIISERGNIYLVSLEDGVCRDGKPLKVDKRIRLYHGDKFVIGQTLFTYVEHDV